jgi:hypothetical protein
MELFSLRKIRRLCPQHRGPRPPVPAHGSTDFIKRWSLATGLMSRIKPIESVSLLRCLDSIWRWVAISSSQPIWCWGAKHRCTIFHPHAGLVRILEKACGYTLHRTCVFPSGGICGSWSAFWCVWGAKPQGTVFHARVGPVQFPWKAAQTNYAKHVFFIPWDLRVT